jgi:hypothetical protein
MNMYEEPLKLKITKILTEELQEIPYTASIFHNPNVKNLHTGGKSNLMLETKRVRVPVLFENTWMFNYRNFVKERSFGVKFLRQILIFLFLSNSHFLSIRNKHLVYD